MVGPFGPAMKVTPNPVPPSLLQQRVHRHHLLCPVHGSHPGLYRCRDFRWEKSAVTVQMGPNPVRHDYWCDQNHSISVGQLCFLRSTEGRYLFLLPDWKRLRLVGPGWNLLRLELDLVHTFSFGRTDLWAYWSLNLALNKGNQSFLCYFSIWRRLGHSWRCNTAAPSF